MITFLCAGSDIMDIEMYGKARHDDTLRKREYYTLIDVQYSLFNCVERTASAFWASVINTS